MDDETPVNVVDGKVLHPDLLPECVKKTSYAVRGELYLRAQELQREGREIIYTNIGNPQALGLKPPRFAREVLALVLAPFLLDDPNVDAMFPKDAVARAKSILELFKGAVGAYSDSKGNRGVREEVASFIERRDGHPSDPENIFLSNGASMAVRLCLEALLRDGRDAVLVPVPQYPLYSATLALLGGTLLGYYLDEENGWAMDLEEIRKQANDARAAGKAVRALAYINPGNPTGQCLTYDNVAEIIKFAYNEKVVLLADEVYQENIYQDARPFVSSKKVLMDLGEPYSSTVELACFHTVSKGTIGECGLRGGYVEFTNIHPGTLSELYKLVSIQLCPNNVGQIAVSLSVNPPQEGDESYEVYKQEREDEVASLRRRASLVTEAFNQLDGVSCNFTEGAMYSFPKISLPPKAVEAAEELCKAPDVFYCLKLLESTGISTVPGSGFGQKSGTFHLRTTILPREEVMESFCAKFKEFHEEFMTTYA